MKRKSEKPNGPYVTYVKLSVHFRKYLHSRYGKDVVCLPVYSPLYGCMSQYIVNNSTLSPITPRACSQYAFCHGEYASLSGNQERISLQPFEKEEYVPLLMPKYVYRSNGMVPTSPFWQLNRVGAVEFNRLVKAEFWCECIRFIDECFTSARIQGRKMTRESAISDFMVSYDIPMSCYENIIRYDQRIRKEIIEDIDKRRAWMEMLNDTVMTYT